MDTTLFLANWEAFPLTRFEKNILTLKSILISDKFHVQFIKVNFFILVQIKVKCIYPIMKIKSNKSILLIKDKHYSRRFENFKLTVQYLISNKEWIFFSNKYLSWKKREKFLMKIILRYLNNVSSKNEIKKISNIKIKILIREEKLEVILSWESSKIEKNSFS